MAAPPVVAVVGLQAGDEGKGTVVDALVRCHCSGAGQQHQPLVVRFNGGPQSAHHVVRV
jgi:adenylosuccinate synthase